MEGESTEAEGGEGMGQRGGKRIQSGLRVDSL